MTTANRNGNLATEERLRWITEQLNADGRVEISATAAELGVSEMTIRRDLRELEARGEVQRVRGGALPVGPLPFANRHRSRAKAKSRIAAKLGELVPDTGAIAFDASSTVMRLAATLAGPRDLVVLTNGPETFQALQDKPGVTPMLTGGQLEPRTGSLVGPLACRAAGHLAVRRLFLSAAALDPALGPTETCIEEAEVKRALAAAADEVVLAVDSSKLGSRAVAVGVEWDRVDLVVTELDPGDRRLAPYRDRAEVR